ncbi:thiamine phosphate synthase [Vibrio taketomensis]|uniref:thiamine phosphate synthase n=1 Tax=Vibrio taketomensis TaxID=2572923 RepID=UPI00138A0E8A|nr:thiamine phosphate synthase [Vibrio taketomensis]
MMVEIRIPKEQSELIAQVQLALSAANNQNFDTQYVAVVESYSNDCQVVTNTFCHRIGSDLWQIDSNECDFYVQYQHPCNSLFVAEHHILIDVRDNNQTLDIWVHPLSGEVRALRSNTNVRETKQHLAWLLVLLALDFPLEDALTVARAKNNVPRETWPSKYCDFPTPVLHHEALGISVGWRQCETPTAFHQLSEGSLGLYPVVDSVEWVERLLKMGIKTIQLRIKEPATETLEQQIIQAIALGREFDAQVFINDYWQLALEHKAFGVHLGQEDLEESNIEQLQQAGISLGLSTHGYYELLRIAQLKPSYIALGHVFPTTTKQMPSNPQGLVRLALYQQLISSIPNSIGTKTQGYPTVAIGGIDLSNAAQVWHCGVSSLAVVRAITLSESPQQVIDQFRRIMAVNQRGVRHA